MEKNILYGPKPTIPLEDGSAGQYLYNTLKRYRNITRCMTNTDTNATISYKELLRITCRLADSFSRNGYFTNTVISICSENSFYYMYPVIAALYGGLITAPANQNYTERELLNSYNVSKPKVIFCSMKTLPKIVSVKRKLPFIEKIIIIDSTANIEGVESLSNFIDRSSDVNLDVDTFKTYEFDRDDQVAAIMSSSGTTGLPKGVMITHRNLMTRFNHCKDPQCSTSGDVKPGGAILNFMPLYHSFGFTTSLEHLSVETAWIIPATILFLVKSPLVDHYDVSSLTQITVGSAPLSKETIATLQRRLNVKHIRPSYGLTESTLMVSMAPVNSTKIASSGKMIPFMAAKIIDLETKETLGPYKSGEICLKGDLLMKGYIGNSEATKNAIDEDGWLHTGDVGYHDEEGDLYIVDRIKELIKYKSYQVAPAELEGLLLQHPKIKDAAVVGMPDDIAGELPTAFVVTQPNSILSEKEVQDFIIDQVAPEKRLRGGIRFVDAIPKNPTGKIMRKKLLEMLRPKSKL